MKLVVLFDFILNAYNPVENLKNSFLSNQISLLIYFQFVEKVKNRGILLPNNMH